jgi:hypothetical protein
MACDPDKKKATKRKGQPPAAAMPIYRVLRDSNEPAGHGWAFPPSATCAGTETRNLYTGDYSLDGYYDPKLFVIERKHSVAELVQNVTNKEKWDDFKDELRRLEEFRWPFCVCEFPFSLFKTYPKGSTVPERMWPFIKVKPQFLLMRMEEIFLHFKTRFLFCDTPALAHEVASGLFKRVLERAPDPAAAA